MKYEMTCPDCQGRGWFEVETYTESCVTCEGNGTLTIAPTPGPWTILEVEPARGDYTIAGLYTQAPEGHMHVYSAGTDEHCFEVRSSTTNMNYLWGSGDGGLIARIPITHGPAGRAQAIMNAQTICDAARAALARPAAKEDAR